MEFLFQGLSQESLWLLVVLYDLLLVVILYKFFGKYGLYTAVVLGIILGNLQGGKVSEFIILEISFLLTEIFLLGSLPPYKIAGIKPLARSLLLEPVERLSLLVAFKLLINLLKRVYNP